jgi:RNA polymerase sigma factor (sigma-70 family)
MGIVNDGRGIHERGERGVPSSETRDLPPFQWFLETHRDEVWRVCVALAGPREAEDCYQETFLAALRAYPRLRHGGGLRAWVLTIAHRKAMDAHRRLSRGPRATGHLPDVQAPATAEHDEELWALVRALPAKQRAAVAYRFVSDLAYRDIAAMMSCTPEAARRNVHEGIRKLRKELEA